MSGNQESRGAEVSRARRRAVVMATAVVPEHVEDVDAWLLASAAAVVGAGTR